MELTSETEIKYTISNKLGELYFITLKMKQIEGITPCFYEQIKDALGLNKDEIINIVKREIIE